MICNPNTKTLLIPRSLWCNVKLIWFQYKFFFRFFFFNFRFRLFWCSTPSSFNVIKESIHHSYQIGIIPIRIISIFNFLHFSIDKIKNLEDNFCQFYMRLGNLSQIFPQIKKYVFQLMRNLHNIVIHHNSR